MKKIYYTWRDVEGAVLDITRQLLLDNWKPDYIVGLSRGGLAPAVMLSQFTGVKMQALQVSLRDSNDCASNVSIARDAFVGKRILVVDDINDQGSTIAWIKKDWSTTTLSNSTKWSEIWGNTVRFAVLTNNLASKEDVQYSAWGVNKLEEDCWLVFPWEEFWKLTI